MIPQLQALGHADVRTVPPGTFKANVVEWLDGHWIGGADPRSEGTVSSE
jgi:gamma-glutamyltranspeptidase/glutathione hydrolase